MAESEVADAMRVAAGTGSGLARVTSSTRRRRRGGARALVMRRAAEIDHEPVPEPAPTRSLPSRAPLQMIERLGMGEPSLRGCPSLVPDLPHSRLAEV